MELFNPHDNNWLLNKFDTYKVLRELDKMYYSEKYKMHIVTRYDDVMFALGNPDIFSSSKGNLIIENPNRFGNTLGASDNPVHDILKNIVKNAYSKDNVARVSKMVTDQMDIMLPGKDVVNISDVIDNLSAWATAEILNLPKDKTMVKDMVLHIQRHASTCVSENVDNSVAIEFSKMLINLMNINKLEPTGPGIYYEYYYSNPKKIRSFSLFAGPTISGASSLTGGLQFLTLDLFRENLVETVLNDRSLVTKAVNESLRFHASTGRFSRTVVKPVTIHNVELQPGDRVALCLESANRDPNKFPDPEKFDLNRNTNGHLAFGHGLHSCIALAISKVVMADYLNRLLDIMGNYRVITPNNELRYVMTSSGNDDMIKNIVIEKINI